MLISLEVDVSMCAAPRISSDACSDIPKLAKIIKTRNPTMIGDSLIVDPMIFKLVFSRDKQKGNACGF